MHPDYDARVACIPETLRENEVPRYAAITAGEHIRATIERSLGES